MRKRPERPDEIPEMRARSGETNWLFALMASVKTMEQVDESLGPRLDAIAGRQELREIAKDATRLTNDLVMTWPQEKRKTLRNQARYLYYQINVGIPAGQDKTCTAIDVHQLGVILKYAHDTCKLCVNPERCNRCELGKAFDRCVPECRGKKDSWADIDIS